MNFQSPRYGGKITIESIEAHSVYNAADSLVWAEFTVTFCKGMIQTADSYGASCAYTEVVEGVELLAKVFMRVEV